RHAIDRDMRTIMPGDIGFARMPIDHDVEIELAPRPECESICRGPRIAPWRLVGVASLRRQQRFNSGSNRRSFGLRIGLGQFAQMPIDESAFALRLAKFL